MVYLYCEITLKDDFMKVLHIAQYIYNNKYPEFQKNKSGLGIMVHDICNAVSEYDQVYLLTHAITQGHKEKYTILRHKWSDVIKGLSIKNVFNGFSRIIKSHTSLKTSLRLLYYAINVGCLKQAIKDIKPDLVHIHEYTPAMQDFINYCEKIDIPYIVTCHGLLLEKNCEQYIKNSEKHMMQVYNKSDVIITTISTSIRTKLINNYNVSDESRIVVVLNGVETANCKTQKAVGQQKVLLCVGQLTERKNQEQIVRAVNLLNKEKAADFKVYFVGNDTMNGRIQSMIAEYGLSDIIECTGFVDRSKLSEYYRMADGIIVASKDEGFGLPIVEAMAYGVPCVMFDDLDAVGDLYSEIAAIKVENRCDEALARGIFKLLDSEWNADKISAYAQNFSLDTMGQRYHQIYNKYTKSECSDEE